MFVLGSRGDAIVAITWFAVIESMNGARFVHDTLEALGWEVLIAEPQKVKGPAPLACRTDASRRRPRSSATPVCVRA